MKTGEAINAMVMQLDSFASEISRVTIELGIEGRFGGQADMKGGVQGIWKDLTNNINTMITNLTWQVRDITKAITAVANGDFSQKTVTVDMKGEILELKNTINNMVDQLCCFTSEVIILARETGCEGKLGFQAQAKGMRGTWKDLIDGINSMAANITNQIRSISEVTQDMALGRLHHKISADMRGELLELKNVINMMTEQLNCLISGVNRLTLDMGCHGILGRQVYVKGLSESWKDMVNNVNMLAANLTTQFRNIALVITAIACGDFSKKITVDAMSEVLELKNTINTFVDMLQDLMNDIRIATEQVSIDHMVKKQYFGLAKVVVDAICTILLKCQKNGFAQFVHLVAATNT